MASSDKKSAPGPAPRPNQDKPPPQPPATDPERGQVSTDKQTNPWIKTN